MRSGSSTSARAALILTVSAAHAADRGFYFGASGGQAKYDFNVPAAPVAAIGLLPPVAGFVPDPTFVFSPGPGNPVFIAPVPGSCIRGCSAAVLWLPGDDEEGTSWGVDAGYRFNRYLARRGELCEPRNARTPRTPVNMLPFLGGGTLTFHRELETDAVRRWLHSASCRSSDSWELFVRAGILFADTDLTTSDRRQLVIRSASTPNRRPWAPARSSTGATIGRRDWSFSAPSTSAATTSRAKPTSTQCRSPFSIGCRRLLRSAAARRSSPRR